MSLIHIARKGESLGTFKEEEVKVGLQSGHFLPEDLAWKEGMGSWLPLHTFVNNSENKSDQKEMVLTSGSLEPAWERRFEVGFFKAIFQTIAAVLFRPIETFPAMKKEGSVINAIFYYFLLSALSFLIGFFVHNPFLIGLKIFTVSHGFFPILFLGICLLIVLIPIVLSGLVHLSFKIVRGATHPWNMTFRFFCYALGSTAIFQLVPFVSGLEVASCWGGVLFLLGLKKVNQTSLWRFISALLVTGLFMVGLFFLQLFLFVKLMDLLNKYFHFLT